MNKLAIFAVAMAAGIASSAQAGTYRVDVNPAGGVKFAPFGAGAVLEDGMASEGAVKTQAIDGKPVDAWAGHGNSWFIIEAEEGDMVYFTAMNGKSLDQIGQAAIEIPAERPQEDTVEMVEELVSEMDADGQIVRVLKMVEKRTANPNLPAERTSTHDIAGFDAGADEGRDTLMDIGSLGSVTVTRMSK